MMSNNNIFNFQESPYYLEYKDTLFVDGVSTGDTFDLSTGKFESRIEQIKADTWKS